MLENEPQRVLEAQQQKYIEEKENGAAIEASMQPKSPNEGNGNGNGGGNGKKHKKNKPSYADVAANKSTAHGTTQLTSPTRLPHTAHLARDLGIPSRPNPLHLLFGLPSNSRKFNYLSLAINTLLILLCLDFQFTPKLFFDVKDTTFVRVGAVSDRSVKLVARVPESLFPMQAIQASLNSQIDKNTIPVDINEAESDMDATALSGSVLDSIIASVESSASTEATTTPVNEANSAKIVYRASRPAGAWHYGGSIIPSPETDYVSTIELTGLLPSTEYEYALILPESTKDKFITPNVDHPYHFKTWPDYKLSVHQTHFTFAASSCIKQNFPYAPGQDHLSIKGAQELADRIGPDHIEFLVGPAFRASVF